MIINNSDFTIRGHLENQIIDLNNKVIKFIVNINDVNKVELLLWKDIRNNGSFEMIKNYMGKGVKAKLEFKGKVGTTVYEREGETKYYYDLFVNCITLLEDDVQTAPKWAFE